MNGSTGIAVGMATNIPPHNLNELIAAICAVIDRPHISVDEVVDLIPGPDFRPAASSPAAKASSPISRLAKASSASGQGPY